MLIDAKTTAIKPKVVEILLIAGPAAIRAPTMITLETALVTDIKGE
jgi:hypothetical protein